MGILNQIVDVALPIIATGIAGGVVGILVKIIQPIGDIIIKYVEEKIDASGITKLLARHQDELLTAKQIFFVIEEKYRLSQKVEDLLTSKAEEFDKLLLAKIPYLTQDQIDTLRQSIAGEFNKGKQAILNDETLKQDVTNLSSVNQDLNNQIAQLQQQIADANAQNTQLSNYKQALRNKLDAINNAINNNTITDTTSTQSVPQSVPSVPVDITSATTDTTTPTTTL